MASAWCRYCGSDKTSRFRPGPWGLNKSLCQAHHQKWIAGKIKLPATLPREPMHPEENTAPAYLRRKSGVSYTHEQLCKKLFRLRDLVYDTFDQNPPPAMGVIENVRDLCAQQPKWDIRSLQTQIQKIVGEIKADRCSTASWKELRTAVLLRDRAVEENKIQSRVTVMECERFSEVLEMAMSGLNRELSVLNNLAAVEDEAEPPRKKMRAQHLREAHSKTERAGSRTHGAMNAEIAMLEAKMKLYERDLPAKIKKSQNNIQALTPPLMSTLKRAKRWMRKKYARPEDVAYEKYFTDRFHTFYSRCCRWPKGAMDGADRVVVKNRSFYCLWFADVDDAEKYAVEVLRFGPPFFPQPTWLSAVGARGVVLVPMCELQLGTYKELAASDFLRQVVHILKRCKSTVEYSSLRLNTNNIIVVWPGAAPCQELDTPKLFSRAAGRLLYEHLYGLPLVEPLRERCTHEIGPLLRLLLQGKACAMLPRLYLDADEILVHPLLLGSCTRNGGRLRNELGDPNAGVLPQGTDEPVSPSAEPRKIPRGDVLRTLILVFQSEPQATNLQLSTSLELCWDGEDGRGAGVQADIFSCFWSELSTHSVVVEGSTPGVFLPKGDTQTTETCAACGPDQDGVCWPCQFQTVMTWFAVGRIQAKCAFLNIPGINWSRIATRFLVEGRTLEMEDVEQFDSGFGLMAENMLNEGQDIELHEIAYNNSIVTRETIHEYLAHRKARYWDSRVNSLLMWRDGFTMTPFCRDLLRFPFKRVHKRLVGKPTCSADDFLQIVVWGHNVTSLAIQVFSNVVRAYNSVERLRLLKWWTGWLRLPGCQERGTNLLTVKMCLAGEEERMPSVQTCFRELVLPFIDDEKPGVTLQLAQEKLDRQLAIALADPSFRRH